jgi:hypothetical protein
MSGRLLRLFYAAATLAPGVVVVMWCQKERASSLPEYYLLCS